jgi:hypothetical protein
MHKLYGPDMLREKAKNQCKNKWLYQGGRRNQGIRLMKRLKAV